MRFSKQPEVIIIGGGIGGLSAAMHLAHAGASVRIYEQNTHIGGKMNLWESNGFRFDTGPHVLTMLFALDELFNLVGSTIDAELDLVRLDPICRYHFPDGEIFDAPTDVEAAKVAIKRLSPSDLAGFDSFLAHSKRVYELTTPTFLTHDFADHINLVKLPSQMQNFWSLKPIEPLRNLVNRHFSHPKLRQLFNLYALYSGSDPSRCSSLLNVIAYIQWELGTFYPRGGLYQLARKLAEGAQKLGVEIETDTHITEIIVDGKRAKGVGIRQNHKQNTERIYADYLISNRDALSNQSLIKSMRRAQISWEPTPSAFLMLLGVDRIYPNLVHHNSFLTDNEEEEYSSLWDASSVPYPDPTIGVACQSVTDPSKAPPGMSNLFVMTNVPATEVDCWNKEFTQKYRGIILNKLEKMGLDKLERHIVTEQVWTPNTFKEKYGAWRGALYGPSGNGLRQMFSRPPLKDPYLNGLYHVGGSVHPGGGVPMCALSGKIVAEKIIRQL